MFVEYVWLDSSGNYRSKTKVIYDDLKNIKELPLWNYDGSSTNEANTENSEIILKPCSVFKDPFRGGDCLMVLCETYDGEMTPLASNTRASAETFFEKHKDKECVFGIEQEFFLERGGELLAWYDSKTDKTVVPEKQGQYYCGNGYNNAIGRSCVNDAMKRCIHSGIKITGMNAEVAPSQWELQVCNIDINAADNLIMLRYILIRTAESYGLTVNFHPRPEQLERYTGDVWNGSGCHVNFSTKEMRDKDGYSKVVEAVKRLGESHSEDIKFYGTDNEKRLTGKNETAKYGEFTYGVGSRNTSVRIPKSVKNKKRTRKSR
tara:strand:- start:2 stop:958 length:957 start_codon:yes stop_codon:yes gene_type:complete